MDAKTIIKEELETTAANLKKEGIELGKEALEIVAKEMSDLVGRVVVRTEGKADDIYLAIKPILDGKIEEISEA